MRYLLATLLLLTVCAKAQTIRTLGYNASNNTIVGVTNPMRLLFSNSLEFATVEARNATFDNIHKGQFPMFVFHVPSGTAWTDFELKGSQTGFVGMFPPQRLAFYFHSPGTNAFETGGTPLVWFTDSSLDPVRWKRLTNRSSLSASRFNTNGSIGGIVVVITNTNFSASTSASTMAWSMLWRSAAATDTNAAGQQIWRPVFPLHFVPANFNPNP